MADEPQPARWLDLVLVPQVGFDHDGNRCGMGAGFNDRHFAFLRHRAAWRLPPLPHDVPLWAIVTERGIYGPAAADA